MKRSESMKRGIFWVLLGTVLLSPLPFGAIHPWSYTLLAVVVGILVLLWSLTTLVSGAAPPVTIAMIRLPAMLFAGAIAWLIVQSAAWTPAGWHDPIWADAARVLDAPVRSAVSVDPFATRTGIMRLLTYAGIFWLALQYGRAGERTRDVFYGVAIAGIAYAAYGLAIEFTGAEKVLWFDKERYRDALTSTFRYKNAYATYAGMGLICILALLVRALGRENFAAMGPHERLRTILTLVFADIWYLVLGLVLLVTALLLSDSRGGFLAGVLAVIGFAIALRLAPGRKLPYRKTFLALLIAGAAGFFHLSGGTVYDRLSTTISYTDTREHIYVTAAAAIAERPLTGWGLGTFEGVFARFQPDLFPTRTLRAHSEYLDNALGMGIPAALALILAVAALGTVCLRGVRQRQRNNHYPAAGVAVVVLAGLHAAVDFTFQVPAVAATFALLLGVCCGQSWSSLVRRTARADG